MKKIIFTFLLSSGGILAGAQDLKDIKTYVTLQQYPKAKETIDKFLSNESNAKKAEAWYYKAFVYNVLARDEKVTPATAGRAMIGDAYSALKKYRELDPKTPLTTEEQNSTAFNLYYGYYDLGVKAYTAKNYEESYSDFKGALDVHDFIYSNNIVGPNALKFNAMDTDVVWNLVILGTETKKNDELITYYGKIADAGLTEPRFLQAYEGLVLHYKEKKDQAGFNKYLEKGRNLYPKEEFWEAVEIENATEGLSNKELFAKYEEMVAKYPNSYVTFFNYAVELNKYVNVEENRNLPDIELYRKKEPEIIKKAIAIHSTPEANMLMASFYYNNSFDQTEAAGKVKGVKPDDVKKKNEFIAASKQALNDCIPYAETAIDLFSKLPKLKAMEKANYRQAYDMLIEVYRVKGDAAKSAAYKAKKEAIQ